jgi:hypothetical protein
MSKPVPIRSGSPRPCSPACALLCAPRCLATSRVAPPVHGVSTTCVTTPDPCAPHQPAGQDADPAWLRGIACPAQANDDAFSRADRLSTRWLLDGGLAAAVQNGPGWAAWTASAPGTFRLRLWSLVPAPPPHRTDCCRSTRRRGGVKGRFACTFTRHFHRARGPAARSALDAGPEAYHNPAAVWWGAFAASTVIRDQVVIVEPVTALPGQQRPRQNHA